MRVLYVTDSPTVSGAEHVWFGYLPALARAGGEAHVFCSESNRRLRAALDERGVACTTTSRFSRRLIETTFRPAALLEYARAFRTVHGELTRLIRRFRPDVIHSISFPACLYAATAARATRCPHVWHEHNIKRIHAVNTRLYRFVGSTCSWIVGPSDAVTRNLARAGLAPSTLVTLYNGIDLARFNPDDARADAVRRELGVGEAPLVALVGQLLPHKGHRTLIEAAPAILAAAPDTRFLIVGALENPPYEADLREALDAAGLAPAFHFTGWRRDVPDVVRAADLSVVATTTPEPAALSLMEAMAMGRALVATRTGGTAEIVQDGVTGLLFEPGDASALARHVIALLGDPARRRGMGAAGRARVEREFSEARHVAAMLDLYARASTPAP